MSGIAGSLYIDPETGEEKVHLPRAPQLDAAGAEIVSSVSLVVGVDLHPLSLGERVRRFMKTPMLSADLFKYDDGEDIGEMFDEHESPISPHVDRDWETG